MVIGEVLMNGLFMDLDNIETKKLKFEVIKLLKFL